MDWREYTVDSIPEIYGAIDQLEDFILNADLSLEDNRSILYMLSTAATKEAGIRARIKTLRFWMANFKKYLPLQDQMRICSIPGIDRIKKDCDEETKAWRDEVEKYQITEYYKERYPGLSSEGIYLQ